MAGGRKPGSKNVRRILPKVMTDTALLQLQKLIDDGDFQACKFALERLFPALKPVTPEDSLDGELIRAKVDEINVLRVELEELKRLIQEIGK